MELQCAKDENKLVNLSEDDLKIITALKKDPELYEKFLQNPDRIIAQISGSIIK